MNPKPSDLEACLYHSNTLNGSERVFVHNAHLFAQQDLEAMQDVHAKQQAYLVKRLGEFFNVMDVDANGLLSVEEDEIGSA